MCVIPVTFPPDRARFGTSPAPTGSATATNTIGIVAVAALAARLPGVVETKTTSGVEPHQLRGQHRETFELSVSESGFEDQVPPLDVAQLAHALLKPGQQGLVAGARRGGEVGDAVRLPWLLRVRGERPGQD
jgi:hypothetical protein